MIVGLTGKMGSGKSTAVGLLSDLQYNPVDLIKFAGSLYRMQEEIYKIISPVYKRDASFIKDRKLLQFLGTEWGRGINENLWVDLWKAKVKHQQLPESIVDPLIIADDVRFDNEAKAVKDMGGVIIELQSNHTGARIDTKAGISGHASEKGISPEYVDYIIENNGSIEDLKTSLLTLNSVLGLW